MYLDTVYGEHTFTFPLDTREFTFFYNADILPSTLRKQLNPIHSVAERKTGVPVGDAYDMGSGAFAPAFADIGLHVMHEFVEKKVPGGFPNNSWVEVHHHCCDPEPEKIGFWFFAATGSGTFYNVGRTIAFDSHKDSCDYFWKVEHDFSMDSTDPDAQCPWNCCNPLLTYVLQQGMFVHT